MKNLVFTTGMYLQKAIFSFKFPLAVFSYIGLLLIISQDLFSPTANVFYILHYAFSNSTSYFLLVICALPGSAIFAEEWSANRFISVYTRTKKFPFSGSVILSSFLSALLVSMLASAFFMLIISFNYPIFGDTSSVSFAQDADIYVNGGLLISGKYFLYFFADFFVQGCLMGVFSAMSTVISVQLTDPYTTVVLPMVLYIVITNICGILNVPTVLNPYQIYSHRAYLQLTFFPYSAYNFSVIAMLYPLIYTILLLIIFIIITYFLIKRKYENYNDIG